MAVAVYSSTDDLSAGISTDSTTATTDGLVQNIDSSKVDTNVIILDSKELSKYLKDNSISYEQWKITMEQSSKELPRDQELALYNEGYDFYDIQVAEDLSGLCDKTPQELLLLKGKATYKTVDGKIVDSSKPWDDIIKKLNIEFQTPTEALGVTSTQINEMKQKGLSDNDIEQIVILSFSYKKDYNEILTEIEKGKGIDDLKKQYWQNRQDGSKELHISEKKARESTEKLLRKQYNISDADIEKCKKSGITNVVEIAIAKDIANKNNTKLDHVLNIKKNKTNWDDVRKEAGGE